jgi:thymidine kinase
MSLKSQNQKAYGLIEVICGSMFSGKTKLLINKVQDAKKESLNVKVFKPKIDTRYNKNKIVSHEKKQISAIPVNDSSEILKLSKVVDLVAVDEAQFFNKDIVQTCIKLAKCKTNIILAGLDMDYLGKPFGSMPELMNIADNIIKLHAICDVCNKKAHHTYRVLENSDTILLGEKGDYIALCKKCFNGKKSNNV